MKRHNSEVSYRYHLYAIKSIIGGDIVLRTQSVENLMKVHRLFMCGGGTLNAFASVGLFMVVRHVTEWSELLSFLIAGGTFTVLFIILSIIFDKALVLMYNDWLVKDTANMLEMIDTGAIIPEESYQKFAQQLCEMHHQQ